MMLSDYLQNGETVHCETAAKLREQLGTEKTGTITCTESRLIFTDGKIVKDIDLGSIEEITTSEPNYFNGNTIAGIFFMIVAILAFLIVPGIDGFEDLMPLVALISGFVGVMGIVIGLYYAKWFVVVRTTNSKYHFMSSDDSISNVPHAIRGAQ